MPTLKNAKLFVGMSEPALGNIEAVAEEKVYLPGAFIFHEGDRADHLFVLQEGRVRLRMGEEGQVAYVLSTPGEVFGWACMANVEEYTLSAQCVLPARTLRLGSEKMHRILEADPSSGLIFYRGLSELIGQRLINSYKATLSVHGEKRSPSYG